MAFAPITQELIKEALQYVLDESRHPLLLMSSSGTHQVGVLVGCLRRQQGWNLASILDEYRSFASPSALTTPSSMSSASGVCRSSLP